jgi:hypothetical protein
VEVLRIEAKNKAALRAAEEVEIQANGYFTDPKWREFVSPDACERYHGKSYVTRFREQAKSQPMTLPPIPAHLSIPAFLDRRLLTLAEAA